MRLLLLVALVAIFAAVAIEAVSGQNGGKKREKDRIIRKGNSKQANPSFGAKFFVTPGGKVKNYGVVGDYPRTHPASSSYGR
jgi:hypothetical protein